MSNSDYTQNAVGHMLPLTIDAFYSGGVDPASPHSDSTRLSQSSASQLSQRFATYTLAGYGQDEWKVKSNLALTLALRAEHQSNPVCAHDCFSELSGPFESISHDPAQPYNQAISKRKQAFFHKDAVDWAPRFSFAWQPLGVSHNTVVRGGFGMFYELTGGFATFFSNNPPLVNRVTVFGAYNLAPEETNSLFKVAAASNAAFVEGFAAGENLAQIKAAQIKASDHYFFPPSIIIATNNTHSPQYQEWSLEVQQTLGTNTSVTLGYYGNHGIHEFVQNPSANAYGWGPFPTTLCSSPSVPPCADPRFSGVTEYGTPGISNYTGMVVSFRRRFAGFGDGLFQANYTSGHALDEVSNGGLDAFTAGSSVSPQDPFNLRGSYGAADYDVRHSLNANYVWDLPLKTMLHGHGYDSLVKGWQVSGTIFARTGFPYTVIDLAESGNLASKNFNGTIYSVPVAPLAGPHSCGAGAVVPPFPQPCWPPQVLADGGPNPGALFVQTGCETSFNVGNVPGPTGPCSGAAVSLAQGRNRFRYPSYFNTDFTIMKKTSIVSDKVVLGIGFQFFNFFNHPNFGPPDNYSSDPGFGEISTMEMPPTSILGSGLGGDVSPRMIQLKTQIQF
ncbi:MAG: TonB-dependent receptor [Acidobacteria bacterium]|nr:TonB-dependent receptor [Acidobacteriota bacterium]